VRNEGYLPTFMTQRALQYGTAGPVTVSLDLPPEAQLVMGQPAQTVGHLAGRDERSAPWSPWLREWNQTAKKVEWLVRAPAGTAATLTAQSQRAGVQRQRVSLL